MSILVRGMKMPENCMDCPIDTPICDLWLSRAFAEIKGNPWYIRHPNCPLVEVPPHGRLIDADALQQSLKESIDECHKWAVKVEGVEMYARVSQTLATFVECSLRVKAAPTIIPAVEDER